LINNKADIAVHSMKDVPPILPDDLMISAILPREDASDVLLSTRFNSLKELPKCAIVGTSSVRRTVQLLAIRPDLTIKLLRGNIDTRLKKLHDGQYDAIILAAAGLKRLDLENHITEYLSFEQCLPSVAQGAIGIELRANDQATKKIIAPLNDENTFICVTAERSLIQHLNGNCHSPIGAYAEIKNEILLLQGLLANSNGTKIVREKISGNIPDSEMLAISLAKKLKSLL
jgi:hydroxymethylbilane synthase